MSVRSSIRDARTGKTFDNVPWNTRLDCVDTSVAGGDVWFGRSQWHSFGPPPLPDPPKPLHAIRDVLTPLGITRVQLNEMPLYMTVHQLLRKDVQHKKPLSDAQRKALLTLQRHIVCLGDAAIVTRFPIQHPRGVSWEERHYDDPSTTVERTYAAFAATGVVDPYSADTLTVQQKMVRMWSVSDFILYIQRVVRNHPNPEIARFTRSNFWTACPVDANVRREFLYGPDALGTEARVWANGHVVGPSTDPYTKVQRPLMIDPFADDRGAHSDPLHDYGIHRVLDANHMYGTDIHTPHGASNSDGRPQVLDYHYVCCGMPLGSAGCLKDTPHPTNTQPVPYPWFGGWFESDESLGQLIALSNGGQAIYRVRKALEESAAIRGTVFIHDEASQNRAHRNMMQLVGQLGLSTCIARTIVTMRRRQFTTFEEALADAERDARMAPGACLALLQEYAQWHAIYNQPIFHTNASDTVHTLEQLNRRFRTHQWATVDVPQGYIPPVPQQPQRDEIPYRWIAIPLLPFTKDMLTNSQASIDWFQNARDILDTTIAGTVPYRIISSLRQRANMLFTRMDQYERALQSPLLQTARDIVDNPIRPNADPEAYNQLKTFVQQLTRVLNDERQAIFKEMDFYNEDVIEPFNVINQKPPDDRTNIQKRNLDAILAILNQRVVDDPELTEADVLILEGGDPRLQQLIDRAGGIVEPTTELEPPNEAVREITRIINQYQLTFLLSISEQGGIRQSYLDDHWNTEKCRDELSEQLKRSSALISNAIAQSRLLSIGVKSGLVNVNRAFTTWALVDNLPENPDPNAFYIPVRSSQFTAPLLTFITAFFDAWKALLEDLPSATRLLDASDVLAQKLLEAQAQAFAPPPPPKVPTPETLPTPDVPIVIPDDDDQGPGAFGQPTTTPEQDNDESFESFPEQDDEETEEVEPTLPLPKEKEEDEEATEEDEDTLVFQTTLTDVELRQFDETEAERLQDLIDDLIILDERVRTSVFNEANLKEVLDLLNDVSDRALWLPNRWPTFQQDILQRYAPLLQVTPPKDMIGADMAVYIQYAIAYMTLVRALGTQLLAARDALIVQKGVVSPDDLRALPWLITLQGNVNDAMRQWQIRSESQLKPNVPSVTGSDEKLTFDAVKNPNDPLVLQFVDSYAVFEYMKRIDEKTGKQHVIDEEFILTIIDPVIQRLNMILNRMSLDQQQYIRMYGARLGLLDANGLVYRLRLIPVDVQTVDEIKTYRAQHQDDPYIYIPSQMNRDGDNVMAMRTVNQYVQFGNQYVVASQLGDLVNLMMFVTDANLSDELGDLADMTNLLIRRHDGSRVSQDVLRVQSFEYEKTSPKPVLETFKPETGPNDNNPYPAPRSVFMLPTTATTKPLPWLIMDDATRKTLVHCLRNDTLLDISFNDIMDRLPTTLSAVASRNDVSLPITTLTLLNRPPSKRRRGGCVGMLLWVLRENWSVMHPKQQAFLFRMGHRVGAFRRNVERNQYTIIDGWSALNPLDTFDTINNAADHLYVLMRHKGNRVYKTQLDLASMRLLSDGWRSFLILVLHTLSNRTKRYENLDEALETEPTRISPVIEHLDDIGFTQDRSLFQNVYNIFWGNSAISLDTLQRTRPVYMANALMIGNDACQTLDTVVDTLDALIATGPYGEPIVFSGHINTQLIIPIINCFQTILQDATKTKRLYDIITPSQVVEMGLVQYHRVASTWYVSTGLSVTLPTGTSSEFFVGYQELTGDYVAYSRTIQLQLLQRWSTLARVLYAIDQNHDISLKLAKHVHDTFATQWNIPQRIRF